MKYKEIITKNYDEYSFKEPIKPSEISTFESEIGFNLPLDLKEFLLETNGASIGNLIEIFGINNGKEGYLDLIKEWKDPEYKLMYPNSQNLFFFASDGMGGFFGYQKKENKDFGDIYYWDHEEDRITFVATDISEFIINCYKYIE